MLYLFDYMIIKYSSQFIMKYLSFYLVKGIQSITFIFINSK